MLVSAHFCCVELMRTLAASSICAHLLRRIDAMSALSCAGGVHWRLAARRPPGCQRPPPRAHNAATAVECREGCAAVRSLAPVQSAKRARIHPARIPDRRRAPLRERSRKPVGSNVLARAWYSHMTWHLRLEFSQTAQPNVVLMCDALTLC